jgi:TolA-binding protein
MANSQDPSALLKYFESLDTGSAEDAGQCAMHYGCACVVHRGRQAARMLVEVQRALGLDGASAAAAPPVDDGRVAELTAKLKDADARAREAAEETEKLTADNDRLRDHIRLLQRQLDRLYDRRELNSVLNRIEGGRDPGQAQDDAEASPAAASEREATGAEAQNGAAAAAESPAEAADSPAESRGKKPPDDLADMLDAEGAMPIPPEEKLKAAGESGPDAAKES